MIAVITTFKLTANANAHITAAKIESPMPLLLSLLIAAKIDLTLNTKQMTKIIEKNKLNKHLIFIFVNFKICLMSLVSLQVFLSAICNMSRIQCDLHQVCFLIKSKLSPYYLCHIQ